MPFRSIFLPRFLCRHYGQIDQESLLQHVAILIGTVEFPSILYCKLVDIDGAAIINKFEFDDSDVFDNASTAPESNEGVKRSYIQTCLIN